MEATAKATWTGKQALAQAVVCLLLGLAVGYFLRGSKTAVPPQVAAEAARPAPSAAMPQVTPAQLQQMAEKQAAPLLSQLQSDPGNPQLLAKLGFVYYATRDFAQAAQYYQRSLAAKDDPAVRIELGRAEFYAGDTAAALGDFDRVLKRDPGNANALYNVGMIKWQSQYDVDGAIAAWQTLLDKNPNHPRRAEVQELIARARQHGGMKRQ